MFLHIEKWKSKKRRREKYDVFNDGLRMADWDGKEWEKLIDGSFADIANKSKYTKWDYLAEFMHYYITGRMRGPEDWNELSDLEWMSKRHE